MTIFDTNISNLGSYLSAIRINLPSNVNVVLVNPPCSSDMQLIWKEVNG